MGIAFNVSVKPRSLGCFSMQITCEEDLEDITEEDLRLEAVYELKLGEF